MKSHFTIRLAPRDNYFQLRIFLSEKDAREFDLAGHPLTTPSGVQWSRWGYAHKVNPRKMKGGWVWDCSRVNDGIIRSHFPEMQPGERRYYRVFIGLESVAVDVAHQLTQEELDG